MLLPSVYTVYFEEEKKDQSTTYVLHVIRFHQLFFACFNFNYYLLLRQLKKCNILVQIVEVFNWSNFKIVLCTYQMNKLEITSSFFKKRKKKNGFITNSLITIIDWAVDAYDVMLRCLDVLSCCFYEWLKILIQGFFLLNIISYLCR